MGTEFYSLIFVFAIILYVVLVLLITTHDSAEVTTPAYVLKSDFLTIDPVSDTCPTVSDKLTFFNLSAVKNKTGFQGVVRGCNFNLYPHNSYSFNVKFLENGTVEIFEKIDLDYENMNNCGFANGVEDVKLFHFKGETWGSGTCLGHSKQINPEIAQVCLFKLSDPRNTFVLLETPFSKSRMEKNWSFFEHRRELLCEYSISPHTILHVDIETGRCVEIFSTPTITEIGGDFRLNSHPICWDETSYLGVGHIESKRNYVHFFYTFNKAEPFEITAISKPFKLENKEKIQFVGGLSLHDEWVYISYGVEDKFNRISKFTTSQVKELLAKSYDEYAS